MNKARSANHQVVVSCSDGPPRSTCQCPFEHGEMLYRADTGKAVAFTFETEVPDVGISGTWRTEDILDDRNEPRPLHLFGMQAPVRGFRDVWSRSNYQAKLGRATRTECAFRSAFTPNTVTEYGSGALQDFPHGGGRMFYVPLAGRVVWIVEGSEPGPGTFLRVRDESPASHPDVILVDFHPPTEPDECVLKLRQSAPG
jgi:hypothetical protein